MYVHVPPLGLAKGVELWATSTSPRNIDANVRGFETAEVIEFQGSRFEIERVLPPIKPLNTTQATYLHALQTSGSSQ